MSVYKKLNEARIMLQNTKLNKSGHNKFAGYTYFELGDFLPAAQSIFAEIGLCGIVSYAQDVATLSIHDVDGEGVVTITSPMAEANLKGCHPIQNLGAVETYTRRYLWVTAMEIVEHDALDATTGSDTKGVKHKPTENPLFVPDADEETFLLSVVDSIISAKEDVPEATRLFYGQNLDNDQQVWIWNKLGKESALRRAMKEHHSTKKEQ